MKAEYDLSKMKSRRNPYASKLKKPVTMRLSEDVVAYFKDMAADAGVPYQSLINLYLRASRRSITKSCGLPTSILANDGCSGSPAQACICRQ